MRAAHGWITSALFALVACGGSGSSARSHTQRPDAVARGDAGPHATPSSTRDPLVALAGGYQPAGQPYPRLELRPDASYTYTTGSRADQSLRGEAMLEDGTLTLTPNVVGGTIEPIELSIRTYSGRTLLLRAEHRDAFDLVPSLQLGLLSRRTTDPPDTIAPPDEPPQPNPPGPNGAAALPLILLVRASFPAAADRPGLRLEVTSTPHRVEISGCESRTPNRECGGVRRRTLGVGAWLELVRLWWATSGPRSCTAVAPVPGAPPAPSDSFYSVQTEGGASQTGVLPPSADDPSLTTPCAAEARIVWWLASQFSLR